MPTKQALCDVAQPTTPLGQPPEEVLAIARQLRAAFGPGVKLVRVTSDDGLELGNPAWDALAAMVDKPLPPQ